MTDERSPLPPEVLANALQDRVHADAGRVRAAASVKVGSAQPEPVGWWDGRITVWWDYELMGQPAPDGCTIPLYTAPPAREWVGLTEDDIRTLLAAVDHESRKDKNTPWFQQLILAAERMLKAKNT